MNSDEFVIPDVQAEPGLLYPHMEAAGRLCVERQPGTIIQLGDLRDYKSISDYDSPQAKADARYDVKADIDAGNEALEAFMRPIRDANRNRNHRRRYHPKLVLLRGNHEQRRKRYTDRHTELRGMFADPALYAEHRLGWEVIPFLVEWTSPGGVGYVHFVKKGASKHGLRADRIPRECHRSVTTGHVQGLQHHVAHNGKTRIQAIVAGSFYEHHMCYSSPHFRNYWRGVVYKHDVRGGEYSPEFISIESLLSRYGA